MKCFFVILDSCMVHMDIRSPKLIWHEIICHVIIYIYIYSFSFPRLWSHGLHFCHGMLWNFLKFFLKFCWQIFLTPFKQDVHVYLFMKMYMFVNYICTRYIKACIHQRLNPRPHGSTLRFLTTKSLQHFMNKDEKI